MTILREEPVHATHVFLTEGDIQKLIPFVNNGLFIVETLVAADDTDWADRKTGRKEDRKEDRKIYSVYGY